MTMRVGFQAAPCSHVENLTNETPEESSIATFATAPLHIYTTVPAAVAVRADTVRTRYIPRRPFLLLVTADHAFDI